MNILFLGSGSFGVPALRMLAAERGAALRVATVPDASRGRSGAPQPTPVKRAAAELGVPCIEVETLRDPDGARLLSEAAAELVLTADIRLLLPGTFLRAARLGCYNLHGSLLPKYRGAAPIARAILAGDFRFGVTLYRMVRTLDAGPIVGAERFDPPGKISAPVAEEHLARLGAELLRRHLGALESGTAVCTEQDDALATLAPKLTRDDGWIDWRRAAADLENQVLALEPWPRSFTEWEPAGAGAPIRIFIEELRALAGEFPPHPPGGVRCAGADGIDVACGPLGAGGARIVRLQRAGRRSMTAAEFLNGTPLTTGGTFDQWSREP